METIISGIKNYLTNWKNLLLHTVIGVIILTIALFAPVSPYIRIAFVGVVVVINILRMKYLDGD
jgi:diacylglycerol kinase